MHDNRLLGEALDRSFRLPEARFYAADAGFSGRPGLALPWPATRYWLGEWEEWREAGGPEPGTPEELYNLHQARIRNVVERTFSILKRRWKVIRSSPP